MELSVTQGIKQKLKVSFALFVLVLTVGTGGYMFIQGPNANFIDAFYMTAITVTTVGYGEIVDLSGNPWGRLFTVGLLFAGMGVIVYFVSNVTAFFIEGNLKEYFWRNQMLKNIAKMKGHYIVCGAGTLGTHIVEELVRTMRPTVVIDRDPLKVAALADKFPTLGLIEGDAVEDDVLAQAGIERAAGLIAATNNDRDNLVVTLSAKQLSTNIRVVARCNDVKHMPKLKRAGADAVVSSNYIAGLRMASEMIRPEVVGFLDLMLRDKDKNLRIDEIKLRAGSELIAKPARIVKDMVLLMAVLDSKGEMLFNPSDDYRLAEGITLIYMGTPEDRQRLVALAPEG